MVAPTITLARLEPYMTYDDSRKGLVWVKPDSNRAKVGALVGARMANGYRATTVDGKKYLVHHLVWLWHYGTLPPIDKDVDHKNGVRDDNRVSNLRLVTRSVNLVGGLGRKNPLLPGVTRTPAGRFTAHIHISRKRTYIGTFDSPEEAHKAYVSRHIAEYGESSKFHPGHPRNA